MITLSNISWIVFLSDRVISLLISEICGKKRLHPPRRHYSKPRARL